MKDKNKNSSFQILKDKAHTDGMVFTKNNYILMIAGLVLILLGLIVMSGSEDIYGFTKITLAPIIITAGFIIEIFAIFHTPKSN